MSHRHCMSTCDRKGCDNPCCLERHETLDQDFIHRKNCLCATHKRENGLRRLGRRLQKQSEPPRVPSAPPLDVHNCVITCRGETFPGSGHLAGCTRNCTLGDIDHPGDHRCDYHRGAIAGSPWFKREEKKEPESPRWRSLDGRTLFPHEFEDAHLRNTIKYIERRYDKRFGFRAEYPALPLPKMPAIYPFLLVEARKRDLAMDQPSAIVKHEGLMTKDSDTDPHNKRDCFVYLPSRVRISRELYDEINGSVKRNGECVLRITVEP